VVNEQNRAQLAEIALGTMTAAEKLEFIAQASGVSSTDLMNVLATDPLAAEQLFSTLTTTAPVTVTTPTGAGVQLAAADILTSYMQDQERQRQNTAMAITTNVNMRRYMMEERENNRVLDTIISMTNGSLTSDVQVGITTMRQQSATLYAMAARETDPAQQQQYLAAAQGAMQQARDLAAEGLRAQGTPDYIIEDVQQGRFSSAESVKSALIGAVGYGDASLRGGPFSAALQARLTSMGITPDDIRAWAADPEADLAELRTNPAIGFGRNFDPNALREVVLEETGAVVGQIMIQALYNTTWAENMPVEAVEILAPLSNPGLTTQESLGRISAAASLLDTYMTRETRAALARGEQPPMGAYQQGAIFRVMQDAVNNNTQLAAYVAGQPNGIPSREQAALLSEFLRGVNGTPQFGDGAVSFEQLVPATVQAVVSQYTTSLAGGALQNAGQVQIAMREQAVRFIAASTTTIGNPGGIDMGPNAINEMQRNNREVFSIVEMATLRAMVRGVTESGVESAPLRNPFTGTGSGAAVDVDLIEQELRAMGHDPAEIRAQLRGE
jgi:hypothetical protein